MKNLTVKTIGQLTHSYTSEFQGAKFLSDYSAEAYEILDTLLEEGWYPENTDCTWTAIAVLDGKYYAAFGEDSVTTQSAKLIYVEIDPTEGIKKEYEYIEDN